MDSANGGRKQLSHERILQAAARALRGAGFAGVGVADVMKQAGLTHGGFYAHFESRDALLAEAIDQAGRESARRIAERSAAAQTRGATPLRSLVEGYLSEAHLRSPEAGCPVAALASEMPRQAPPVRDAARRRVRGLLAAVRKALPADAADSDAAMVTASLVGTLQLARTLGDNASGKALLAANREALLARHERTAS
jgi:TetR/AcrR family transcriptional repressor of nem operon